MRNENATGDAPRLYQAVLSHLQFCLWNDQRNAHTFAWMVTGFLFSQRASIPSWLPHVQSRANFAQSTERRIRRWLWDGPVLWTKLIRVPFQGECTAVVAAWVAAWRAVNSWGVRYPNEECGRMLL